MENGTAFFGRADRGGRIWIDGFNATISGGGNGKLTSPFIGDPMWNNMRLTFVDLTHATSGGPYNPGDATAAQVATTAIKDYVQGFGGQYFGMNDSQTSNGFIANQTFPWWYKHIWRQACIVKPGQEPPTIAGIPYKTDVPDPANPGKYLY
jgi:hypothetical protein